VPPRPRSPVVSGRRVERGHLMAGEFTYYSVVTSPPVAPLVAPLITPMAGPVRGAGATPAERRTDRRVGTRLREGIICDAGSRSRLDCLIRDLSRTGAKLMLGTTRALPRYFLLTDTASRTTFRARVMWQAGREVGVKLTPA
jgi:hypothetical protein